MNVTLRWRILISIAIINVVTFGVGLVFLASDLDRQRREGVEQYSKDLAYSLGATIDPQGEISVGQLLRWPYWRFFGDAVIVRKNIDVDVRGQLIPRGAVLNPVGLVNRRADFDEQAMLRDLVAVLSEHEARPSAGGFVMPVVDRRGEVWGGCWFTLPPSGGAIELIRRLAPWFVVSTLLLTLGTFAVLRRYVLTPVERLASGARRVATGDLSVRVEADARGDELTGLIHTFNTMAEKVQGYNARLAHDVEVATEKVRRAEAAAMTQRRLAATGELAAGIAHEINNPLGGLLNAVETLEKNQLPPEKRVQYHALLRSGLERIQDTVGKLLRFTPRTSKPVPLALVDPVLDAIALVSHRAQKEEVEITLGGGRPDDPAMIERLRALPPVLGQANELGQAVLNLLVNALDALESARAADDTAGADATSLSERAARRRGRGHVRVDLAARDTDVVLTVVDDGPGVSRDELTRVADLFYTTKEIGKGTGLGLSIVHGVVSAHGGRVQLSSEVGQGFQVEILLPAWSSDATRRGGVA